MAYAYPGVGRTKMWFVPQKSNKDIFSKSKSKAKTGKKKRTKKKNWCFGNVYWDVILNQEYTVTPLHIWKSITYSTSYRATEYKF